MAIVGVWNKGGVERIEVVCDDCRKPISKAADGVCLIPRPESGAGAVAVGHYHQNPSCLVIGYLMRSVSGGGALIQSLEEHLGAVPGVPYAWPGGGTWIPIPYTPGPSVGPGAGAADGPDNGTDDDLDNDLDAGPIAPPGESSPEGEARRDAKLMALPRARRRG